MSTTSGPLRRVVYVSRALPPEGEARTEMLDSILAAARRNNATAGVTGALLYSHRRFAQVLEGPPNAVEEIFERIQCDARHDDITVLQVGAPDGRAFAAWSMAFAEAPHATPADFEAADRLMVLLQSVLRNTDAATA